MQFNTGKQFDDLVENDLLANVDAQEAAQNWNADPARRVRPGGDPQRPRLCGAGEHPRPELAVLFDRRADPRRRRAADQLGRTVPGARQAEGGRADPAGVQRPEELGAQPVQQRAGRTRRARHVRRILGQARRRHGEEPRVPRRGRDLQAAARLRRSRQSRPQLERRHQSGDPGQGRHAVHGRLGQGRVHRRGPDAGQGLWLHRARRSRHRLCHGRRRVRLPES